MQREYKVELLAPAGNVEAFYGAIHAGADAVYLAGNQYGARAYADNFTQEEILTSLRYAHIMHKKIYLTVNTLLKEEELEKLPTFLSPLVEEGLDAVIVQDFGVLRLIHEEFPDLSLHASTQMNITGVYGAALLKRFGVDRIVPARELSLPEIKRLVSESGMEVECFVHGAMCYCYSGQCLFSSILGGRSGNRGRCAQPCRLPYASSDLEKHKNRSKNDRSGSNAKRRDDQKAQRELYPLSMKDMCTVEILDELISAGICSFKIEGRMKKAEYTAGVTAIYRKYLDACLEGKRISIQKEDLDRLKKLYIRSEIGQGYYHCRNGSNMITLQSPSYSGSDEALLQEVRKKYLEEKKKLPIEIRGRFKLGEQAEVGIREASSNEWITVKGDIVEQATNRPVTKENVMKQLSKLGDSFFCLQNQSVDSALIVEMDDNIFLPLKALNDLRREAVKALEEVILHA